MAFFDEIKQEVQDRMQKAFHYIQEKVKKCVQVLPRLL